jgi:hypothetical protein
MIFAIRRGADIPLQRTDPIACLAHSGSAIVAGTVSGIDHRFCCFVSRSSCPGAGHVTNDVAAYADRICFLATHLDLAALPEALANGLG